jgi:hypothetical protein
MGMTAAAITTESRVERIRLLNDAFRTSPCGGGRLFLTAGVLGLNAAQQHRLLRAVQAFSKFTQDNDPYGEHDFGALDLDGARFFWKIDYYDPTLTGGSQDPTDTSRTTRVLTIMRAEEY